MQPWTALGDKVAKLHDAMVIIGDGASATVGSVKSQHVGTKGPDKGDRAGACLHK